MEPNATLTILLALCAGHPPGTKHQLLRAYNFIVINVSVDVGVCGGGGEEFGEAEYGRHFPDDMFKCIFLNENV